MKQSFAWKRKANNLNHSLAAFSEEREAEQQEQQTATNDNESGLINPQLLIRTAHNQPKKSKKNSGELTISELKEKANECAEAGRYDDAINHWDSILSITPHDETIHEMKSQVLLEMDESYLAVKSAEKAIMCNGLWSVGYQTLGRAQLAIHDYKMAMRSFSISLHLNPVCEELRSQDLPLSLNCYKTQQDGIQEYQQQLKKERDNKLLCTSTVEQCKDK